MRHIEGGREKQFINPLSPKSNENQFSPKDINTLSRENDVRICKAITS